MEYPDDGCSSAPEPDPVTVTVPIKSRALIVMQEAASMNSNVRFSAKYFGSKLGYSIRKLNGTKSDLNESCFWFFYIQDPKGNEFRSPLGVSNLVLRGNGYSIIYRFQRYIPENSTHSNDSEVRKQIISYIIRVKSEIFDLCVHDVTGVLRFLCVSPLVLIFSESILLLHLHACMHYIYSL